ncbi:MAG TPA: ABC transporter permease [Bryobacteraceae bacterium]|nr:ABC transporter permease [Bryobacteraceae bacterium]
MRKLMQDLRFAIRQLRAAPGFAVTTILTLALGIGATTAIFSLVNAVLLRPLPFPGPDRLMSVREGTFPPDAGPSAPAIPDSFSYADFLDWRARNHSFTGMASCRDDAKVLSGHGEARHLNAAVVSSNFLRVLGVKPLLGPGFQSEDDKSGHYRAALSYSLWQSEFGASPAIVGQSITLDGRAYTVVAVMPQDFAFPITNPPIALWTTMADDDEMVPQRGAHMVSVIGRLRPAVTPERARADLVVIARNIAAQYPKTNKTYTSAFVKPELEQLTGNTRPALRMLFAAVTLLLLISCANVAGLLLARASRRSTEIAVRTALGASRREIVRQLLVEAVALALCGGFAGVLLAQALLAMLLRFVPKDLPRVHDVSIDLAVLAFVLVVSVLTGILFGLAPAWSISRVDPASGLRDGARGIASARHRLHDWLVIGETALGLVLLAASGLLIRSLVRTLDADPGFDPRHVMTAALDVPFTAYPKLEHVRFYDDLMSRVSALPGVESVAASYPLPLSGNEFTIDFQIEGRPVTPGDEPYTQLAIVTPEFFRTLRIPVLAGRAFTVRDDSRGAPVMIVNQKFARRFFPGENPIGKRVQPGLADGILKHPWREIVGVVGDVKVHGLTTEAEAQYYLPFAQAVITSPALLVRTGSDPASLIAPVRRELAQMDSQSAMYNAGPMRDSVYQSAAQPRFRTMLLTSFAALALLLSAVGLYAVLSYMVAQRAREIGVRVAVGAQRADILRLVLSRGLALAGAGLITGLALSAALSSLLGGMLYGVRPSDPPTLIAVSALLLIISLTAAAIPAMRAARLDPMTTLRDQ